VTKRALILVDLQNDFLPGGALAVPHGDEVLAVANRLAPKFDLVLATQDWHPPDHQSFADNHSDLSPGAEIEVDGLQQILWPRHCVQGTHGAALAEALDQSLISRLFRKGQDRCLDSYSGFFDNGYRHATGLGDHLRLQGVTEVFIVGLATDYCVKHTALDARKLGFATFLVAEGCRAVDLAPGDGQRAVEAMRRGGVSVLDSHQLEVALADASHSPLVLAETSHLRLVRRNRWDFVQRHGATGVVTIAAVTADNRLLLVEQYRTPVDKRVVELPAGLAGDDGDAEESLVTAARRELLEETGYEADDLQVAFEGPSSAGLTDEVVTFFVASRLRRTGSGGGTANEQITIYEVALEELDSWLHDRAAAGCLIDARLYTGVYLLRRFLAESRR
jgi:nicotinamidase/pyrazinamidase